MKFSKKRIDDFLMAALFLQMIFLPKIWMGIKIIFLALLLFFYLNRIKSGLKVNAGIILILSYVVWNVISIIIGCFQGYGTTAVRVGTVDVLWPLVYVFMSFGGMEEYQLKWLYKTIVIVTFVLAVSDLILIIASFMSNTVVKGFLSLFNKNTIVVEWVRGYMEVRIDHENYYAFLSPFMMALFLDDGGRAIKKMGVNSIFVKVTVVLSVLMAILMGLGSIWLANFAGIVLCAKKFRVFNKKWVLMMLAFVIPGAAVILLKSYLDEGFVYYMWQDLLSRFNMSSVLGNLNGSARSAQCRAMLKAWTISPLFGLGRGVPVSYYRGGIYVTRANNEIGYLVTLYQKGLIGFILFFSLVGYAIYILKKRTDIKWFTAPFMIGLICYLIANIFNPYLTNFSNLWILFLPFVISCKKNTQNRHTNNVVLETL